MKPGALMTVSTLEPLVDIDALARHFCMSRRWAEARLKDGMPSIRVGRSRRFRISRCEDWLVKEGYVQED